jgi:hypothetical protein
VPHVLGIGADEQGAEGLADGLARGKAEQALAGLVPCRDDARFVDQEGSVGSRYGHGHAERLSMWATSVGLPKRTPVPHLLSPLFKNKKPRLSVAFCEGERRRAQAAALSCFSGRAISLFTLNW